MNALIVLILLVCIAAAIAMVIEDAQRRRLLPRRGDRYELPNRHVVRVWSVSDHVLIECGIPGDDLWAIRRIPVANWNSASATWKEIEPDADLLIPPPRLYGGAR